MPTIRFSRTLKSFFVCLLSVFYSCSTVLQENKTDDYSISSPGNINTVNFFISDGHPGYSIFHNGKVVIDSSYFSFDFKGQPSWGDNIEVLDNSQESFNETWQMPWGEQRDVKNNYNQMTVNLGEKEDPNRKLNVVFRIYDDGLGFRYEFLKQDSINEVIIMDENTKFNLTGDHDVWWMPGDWDSYEHLYNHTAFSKIDAKSKRNNVNLAQSKIPENAVNTPVTMKTADGLYLSFHEANLTDYAGMTLKIDSLNLSMTSELVGSDRLGYKVKRSTPFKTPWRTIQIADQAGDLIESNLIVNLNEPNKLGNIPWFKPMKYVGIWWEMHLGLSTWDYASGKHGATTAHTKELIDFAAKNNIGGVLVEGWNTGWEHWIGFDDREGVFDFVTPYPDYDLKEIVRYSKEKGVEMIMHNETSAAPRTYDEQMDTAYTMMENLGIHSVKTGYVGKIIPTGEYHHGQWMVNHYRRVLETAAKHKVAVDAHEPIKDTGIRRTLPNAISREGLRGQEFNAWSTDGGNPPSHLPTIAFTRMLAGPIDFTPGIFEMKLKPYKPDNQINTTIAQQLALYVVIYSPIQMAADLIKNYKDNDAFQFIRDVGVNWETSKVLDGEIGEFVVIARKERETNNWFIGGITNEKSRNVKLTFDFLDQKTNYKARIYKDAPDAQWNDNPTAYKIEEMEINRDSEVTIKMAEGGGFAISLIKE